METSSGSSRPSDLDATPSGVDTPEVRRFGVIGDVHTQAAPLERLLEFYAQLNLDAVMCCGDVLDGSGDALRCVELLQHHRCFVTRGNHERWALEGIMRDWDAPRLTDLPAAVGEWAASLPTTIQFRSPIGPVEMAHGIGDHDMNQLREDSYGYGLEMNEPWQQLVRSGRARMIVKGHTHRREVFSKAGIVVVDGGTLLPYGPPGGVIVDLVERAYCTVDVSGAAPTPGRQALLPASSEPPAAAQLSWSHPADRQGVPTGGL
jgi:predicted phosphodiesterase